MIGGGAIALSLGVFGYSLGSSIALLYAILLIPLNWWVLVLGEDEQRPVIKFQSANWRFVLPLGAVATALELAFT